MFAFAFGAMLAYLIVLGDNVSVSASLSWRSDVRA
jgi:hypothetical protein